METPVVKSRKGLSPIWILPLVAFILGGYLVYKDFTESGIMITVRIKDANGLTPGKTQVFFKGLPVGLLKGFSVTSDLQKIDASIEMVKEAKDKLTSNTKFWVVRPEVSMNRITGLDTLVKGSYFEVSPGANSPDHINFFNALPEPPPVSSRVAGLHLTLTATSSFSLSAGSPVLFKKVEVGEVISQALQGDGSIQVKILIYPKYEKHVTSSSLFFVTNGIHLKASLSGISLKMDPVKSILQGGISFQTPEGGEAIKGPGRTFILYDDLEKIQHINEVEVEFTFFVKNAFPEGTSVHYQGIEVGSVTKVTLNDDLKTGTALAYVKKEIKPFLLENTYMWKVKPYFGLAEVENIDTILKGSYINMIPGTGNPARSFFIHEKRPAKMLVNDGLNIVLETDRLGSLGYNKPVYFRQVQVGHTTGYELSATGQRVLIYLNIHEPYGKLVRENSKFWNTSGVRIKGGLMTSMKISTESLAALLDGGISFSTPERKDMGIEVGNGTHFILHSAPEDKWLNWSPAIHLGDHPADTVESPTDEKKEEPLEGIDSDNL